MQNAEGRRERANGFRENLKRLRERRGISRRVLSELCGLSSDAIRRYERGEAEPTLSSISAIADFFEVSIDYLTENKRHP